MEDWQKEQIKTNLSSLVNNTSINALFLAELEQEDVLSEIDVAQIVAKETNYDQAKLLYEIIVTKANSYYTLIKALTETQQSGATKFLFHPSERIRNLKVHFQDKTQQLGNLLSNDQIKVIQTWLQNSKFSDPERKQFTQILNDQKEVNLLRDTIPKPYSLYIPRFVSVAQIVDPNIFKKSCPDTFVFKNVERSYLINYINSHEIESSTRLLLRKKISSRFILLDSVNDWKKICVKIQETPVHLLKYDDETENFVVEATSGGSEILREHLKYKHSKPEYISEEDFVEQILTQNVKGVCICDSPGMGKSTLLASLARRISKNSPESITSFIQLRDFVIPEKQTNHHKYAILDYISSSKLASQILCELTKTGDNKFNLFFDGLDEVHGACLQSVKKFLHGISESMHEATLFVSSRPVVRAELEKSVGLIAYDILPFNEETQRNYLTAYWLQKYPNSDKDRLNEFAEFCVQNFGKALKTNIEAVSGVPLQCQLIAEVYCDDAAVFADKDRLPEISISLPENIVNSLSEIYSKFMLRQLGSSKCRYACMHKLASSDKLQCDSVCKVKSFHVWEALQLIDWNFAREIMCKEYVSKFDDLKPSLYLRPGILKPGKRDGTYQFLHRTFAEFLVAEYCAKVLFSKPCKSKRNKIYDKITDGFYFDRLLFDNSEERKFTLENNYFFEFRSVKEAPLPYFLNAILTDCLCAGDELCAKFFVSPISHDYFHIVNSCLHADYQNVLKVLLQGLQNYEQQQNSWLNKSLRAIALAEKSEVSLSSVLNVFQVAAQYSDVTTIDQLYQFFRNGLHFDFAKVTEFETFPAEPLPLQVAVNRADFQVVKCLANKLSLKNSGLLYWCFKDTYYENEEIVETKLKIAQLLLSKQADLVTEKYINPKDVVNNPYDDNYNEKRKVPAILSPNIHLKAIKLLVRAGANVKVVDELHRNVYIKALGYMSDEDFGNLRNFLFVECNAQNWLLDLETSKKYFCSVEYNRFNDVNTMLRFLDNMLLEAAIMHKNENVKIKLLRSDVYKDLFFNSVVSGHVEIVNCFLERDLTFIEQRLSYKPFELWTGFYTNYMQYMYSFTSEIPHNQDVEWKHSKNVTPILLAAISAQAEMVRFLVNQGANIFAVDAKGRTVLHLAAISGRNEAFEQIVRIIGQIPDNNLPSYQRDSSSQIEPASIYELFNWQDKEELQTPLHIAAVNIDLSPESLSLFLSCGQTGQPIAMPKLEPFSFTDFKTMETAPDHFKHGPDEYQKQCEKWELSFQNLDFNLFPNKHNDNYIGVNVNAVNKYGHTPLHVALFCRRGFELIKQFVSMGADWTKTDNEGCNVAHICARMLLPDHLEYFLNLGGAEFANQLDNAENNAMECAIYYSTIRKTMPCDYVWDDTNECRIGCLLNAIGCKRRDKYIGQKFYLKYSLNPNDPSILE